MIRTHIQNPNTDPGFLNQAPSSRMLDSETKPGRRTDALYCTQSSQLSSPQLCMQPGLQLDYYQKPRPGCGAQSRREILYSVCDRINLVPRYRPVATTLTPQTLNPQTILVRHWVTTGEPSQGLSFGSSTCPEPTPGCPELVPKELLLGLGFPV